MNIVQLSPVCGVEVQGIDLRKDLTPAEIQEIRHEFLRSHLVLVRNQNIDQQEQARFLSYFGAPSGGPNGSLAPDADFVSTERADDVSGGTGPMLYHFDRSFQKSPPYAVSMYSLKMSANAPPTVFANAEAAYRRLPETLTARLNGLSVVNLVRASADETGRSRYPGRTPKFDVQDEDQERFPHATHPAVVHLPITQAPVLMVNQHQTSHFVGMNPDESEELYCELLGYLYSPENVLSHYWDVGDLVVWNNLAIHHGRAAPEGTYVRELRRMMVGTPNITARLN